MHALFWSLGCVKILSWRQHTLLPCSRQALSPFRNIPKGSPLPGPLLNTTKDRCPPIKDIKVAFLVQRKLYHKNFRATYLCSTVIHCLQARSMKWMLALSQLFDAGRWCFSTVFRFIIKGWNVAELFKANSTVLW